MPITNINIKVSCLLLTDVDKIPVPKAQCLCTHIYTHTQRPPMLSVNAVSALYSVHNYSGDMCAAEVVAFPYTYDSLQAGYT